MPLRRGGGGAEEPSHGRVGSYALLDVIARGGMSTLFLSRRRTSEGTEPVAVKILEEKLFRRKLQRERFRREARILMTLDHPNVVRGLDHGEDRGRIYTVMEHLSGTTLASVMKACDQKSPPWRFLAGLSASAARGLHALHEHRRPSGEPWDLIHRDMSPQNVVVTFDGRVRIVDLGLAEPSYCRPESRDRPPQELSGRLTYLAPEQILGKAVDYRTDIYALGVVLWEAVTLRRLFVERGLLDTKRKILEHDIQPPSRFYRDFPRRLEATIVKALRHDPRERHSSAEELSHELERYVEEAAGSMGPESVADWMSRHFSTEIDDERRRAERLF